MHTLDKKGVSQGRLGVGKLWAWIGQGVSEVYFIGGGGGGDTGGQKNPLRLPWGDILYLFYTKY